MIVTIKPTFPKERYEVYIRNPATWSLVTKELCFDVNVSLPGACWRLVYWENKVVDLFESKGIAHTINNLFCGTEKECLNQIDELNLEWERKV